MSAAKDTGGPAFPTSFSKDYPTEIVGGMTLRDYFAAKAMQGCIASATNGAEVDAKLCASWSYEVADAMLAARSAP